MRIPRTLHATQALKRKSTAPGGDIRSSYRGARIWRQKIVPNKRSEEICSTLTICDETAALQRGRACHNHIAPTPAIHPTNGFPISHDRDPSETHRGRLINTSAGTMSNSKMCCSICALKRYPDARALRGDINVSTNTASAASRYRMRRLISKAQRYAVSTTPLKTKAAMFHVHSEVRNCCVVIGSKARG